MDIDEHVSPQGDGRDEPSWPDSGGRPIVFLLDACSALEKDLLERWIRRNASETDSTSHQVARIPSSRRGRRATLSGRLEEILAAGGDPLMAPLRVAWFPRKFDGRRTLAWSDILTFSDPRDPGPLRQRWTLARHPERCRIVVAEPAPLSELRTRWHAAGGAYAGETTGLADYVARQAALALERAERRIRGARYKVPRLVHEGILGRPAFRGGLRALAKGETQDEERVIKKAAGYLREIAATHDPFVIDVVAHAIRLLYTRGYGEALHYDHARLEKIYSIAQRYPVVFLPTHKSNLDHLVLQYALHEHGHPPNHTAGGINMNFFPVGPLVRRSGVFFIRRSFKDNEVYKFVLRHYIDYLIEKRFSLEWYLEGGRSRSGKLLPPRFGLLAYVVDAYLRAKSEDVILIPVSIAYDQIQEVGDYAAEQGGADKETESFSWFVRIIRKLGRRYGDIHLTFGDPVSVREALGEADGDAEPDPDARSLGLQKLAFQVCVEINKVTPITPTSAVTLGLLGVGDRALTVDEATATLANLLTYIERRELPVTEPLDLRNPKGVRRVLDQLAENGVVTSFDEGEETVFAIGPDQHLAAAYYRNTIIHFFVGSAIVELALLTAGEVPAGEASARFWDEALRLRDLLKFEFFFANRDGFIEEIRTELAGHDEAWEVQLGKGGAAVQELLRGIRPFNAHRVLRPFFESYQVVGDALALMDEGASFDEGKFLNRCLALGKQYRLQRRITRAESVSKVAFASALKLARNRGLVGRDGDPVGSGGELRREFAEEIRRAVKRVETIDVLAASRRAGLVV